MSQVIVFQNNAGGVAVVYPNPQALEEFDVQYIAEKSVPAGKPFKIMDQSALPSREDRAAWIIDPAVLTDGEGDPSNDFDV